MGSTNTSNQLTTRFVLYLKKRCCWIWYVTATIKFTVFDSYKYINTSTLLASSAGDPSRVYIRYIHTYVMQTTWGPFMLNKITTSCNSFAPTPLCIFDHRITTVVLISLNTTVLLLVTKPDSASHRIDTEYRLPRFPAIILLLSDRTPHHSHHSIILKPLAKWRFESLIFSAVNFP